MNPHISIDERLARIRINAFPYFRADWLEHLIQLFGSAQEILRQDAKTLAAEAQLNNVMKRATLLAKGDYISVNELEQCMAQIQPQPPITLHDEQTELQRIEAAIKAAGGNKSKAAQLLAIDRKTLYNKLKKYGANSQ